MARYVLDRYEGDWAILEDEDGRMLKVARDTLPQASEGEALEEADGRWRVDPERTEAAAPSGTGAFGAPKAGKAALRSGSRAPFS